MRKYLIVSKFECIRPTELKRISQTTNHRTKLGVDVPGLGRWCFNTQTHSMTQVVHGERELDEATQRLLDQNIWHAVHFAR